DERQPAHQRRGHEEIEGQARGGQGGGRDEPAGRAEEGNAGEQRDQREQQGERKGTLTPAEKGQEGQEGFHATVLLRARGARSNAPPAMRQAWSISAAIASEWVATTSVRPAA